MSGTPGRPLSAELSEQLMSVAVDILADEGWSRLNSDRIAARARAGKAGIYRRWPSMAALVHHAVGRFSLVETPDDEGSLRGDLAALVRRWTRPLDREERAAASLVGAARHDDLLREGLDAALVRPLAAAVEELGARAAGRGERVEPGRLALLGSVLEAFWWQRYTAVGDGAMAPERVENVLDDVLLPIVQAGNGSGSTAVSVRAAAVPAVNLPAVAVAEAATF
ncbi:TetR/AcrR family transcriptional regulator C-terminal ligand-binding domain-containing protein [Geodermatophilus sp. YIM 151500]|uniref:TetR-like C-terminal domain-containing protein n=1 Tax=Geodermatophilus sp. YIM 151500 TaxID=2984531 RepID=UPI0021E49D5E|nr:TetR-like C-terminal domain-containing protein [Geodermatophilus sp. YIM 151500]MCV2490643.1 TetR/AcrR family transcriptional regulator C-terminal ligand-binding domain-containing protein [Geodermatophilus sp. YIM 151500]